MVHKVSVILEECNTVYYKQEYKQTGKFVCYGVIDRVSRKEDVVTILLTLTRPTHVIPVICFANEHVKLIRFSPY